ncbi:MAG TPA: hypothetical protein VMN38_08070 [Sphingomicrobium sp.]|nr:hypothetical protein [Sphingomicrobium sp.]
MLIFFGPAQAILADPKLQSEKFYAVMADPVHPPRMAESFWIVPAGLMVLAFTWFKFYLPWNDKARKFCRWERRCPNPALSTTARPARLLHQSKNLTLVREKWRFNWFWPKYLQTRLQI